MARPSKPNPNEVRELLRASWRGERQKLEMVWDECLAEMLVLFYPPFFAETEDELTEQAEIALKAYAEDLAQFDRGVLAAGWRQCRRAHKVQRWPSLSEIIGACSQDDGLGHAVRGSDSYRDATQEETEMLRELGYDRMQLRPSEVPGIRDRYFARTGFGSPDARRISNQRSWADMTPHERGEMDREIRKAKQMMAASPLMEYSAGARR